MKKQTKNTRKKPFDKKHHVHFLEPVLRFMSTGAGCLVGVRCETPLVCFREGEGAVEEWILFLLQKYHVYKL